MSSNGNPASPKRERLFALDLLRGLDMFLLVMVGLPMRTVQNTWNCLSPDVWRHFSHGWDGFGFWDVIMPLFIFMCGAATPFALEKRMENGRPTRGFWRHVLGRVALLWVLGMVAQGNLLTLDPMKISPYNNTLQTIAAGYLVTALAMCVRSVLFRRLLPIGLAVAYTLLLALGGDYSQAGNFANKVEMRMLALLVPQGSLAFQTSHYTWFLTTFMFGAMSLCGYNSTKILLSGRAPWRKVATLGFLAAALLATGYGTMPWIPVIKPIFSLSFTALAMGWCAVAYAALYALTDIWCLRRGFGVFMLLGRNSLFAYMIGCFGGVFGEASRELLGGLELWIGKAPMSIVLATGNSLLRLGSVWVWDRLKKARRGTGPAR